MESSLIFTLMMAFCGITLISSKQLTNEQLRKLYDSGVDMEEFVDNIFTLPAPQQLYVYEYLQDLVKNLEKDSEMTKFINDSMKLLQKKIDDFNEEKNLEKVPIKKFIQKRINAQLKASCKKPATDKATNKPPSSPIDENSINKSQTGFTKAGELKTDDSKAKPKITEKTPLKLNQVNNPQNSYLMNSGTLSFSRNSSTISKSKEPVDEKKSLPKLKSEISGLIKSPSSLKETGISTASSSTSIVNDKKSPPSPNSLQIKQKIQHPMPTNPLSFSLMFDTPDSDYLKKPSLKPAPEPSKPVIQSPQKSKENSSKPPLPAKNQINKNKSLPSINITETPRKILIPLQATPASSNLPEPTPKSSQNEVKQPKPVENSIPANKLKAKARFQDDKPSLVKSPSSKSPKSSPKNQKASSAAEVAELLSFSV